MAPDMREAIGRPFFEYWVTLILQSFVKETAHLPDGGVVDVPTPTLVGECQREYNSYNTWNPIDPSRFGPTTRALLGYLVLGPVRKGVELC